MTIIRASWIGTAALFVSSLLAVTVEAFDLLAAGIHLVMFVGGVVAFLWAYGIAVGRSRTDEIGIGGLYFLAGSTAPASVRRQLMGSLAAQVVIAVAAASIRPFSSVAFAILAPMWGLGLAGLWGARYGTFAPRVRQGEG